jgi:hypothetical protein
MGSTELNKLGYRQSWAFIGVQGYKNQAYEKRDGNIKNSVRIEKGFNQGFLDTLPLDIKVESAGFKTGNFAKIYNGKK